MTDPLDSTTPRSAILRRVAALAMHDPGQAQVELERVMQDAHGPLVETLPESRGTVLVTFVVVGSTQQPFVHSQLFRDVEQQPMRPLASCRNAWWAETTAPADAATVYQFQRRLLPEPAGDEYHDPAALGRYVEDVYAVSYADPNNPSRCWPIAALMTAGATAAPPLEKWQSVIALPDAASFPWHDEQPPAGHVETSTVTSSILGNERTVSIWSPAADMDEPLPLVVLLDGECFLLGMQAARVFDGLVHHGRSRGFVAALVHNPTRISRTTEYPCHPHFPQFLADELLPELRSHAPLVDPERTVIGGYSYGGLAACWAAYRRPDAFSDVLALSASLWWGTEPEWLTRQYELAVRKPIRFWLEIGTLETGPLGLVDETVTMLSASRRLRDVLLERGYDVGYRERTGGHDFVNWRQGLAAGLMHLLAAR